jgi:hypothetical protein
VTPDTSGSIDGREQQRDNADHSGTFDPYHDRDPEVILMLTGLWNNLRKGVT